jgi:hypothetical protein
MEQLVKVLNGYDPRYKEKVKAAVEVVQHELRKRKRFAVADVNRHLEFDCDRHLRMLCRRGFLEAYQEGEDWVHQRIHAESPAPGLEGVACQPSGTQPNGFTLLSLRSAAKCIEVTGCGLRQREQLRQQLLCFAELHPQAARLKLYSFRQVAQVFARLALHRNDDSGGDTQSAKFLQGLREPLFALCLHGKVRAGLNRFQLANQIQAINQEGAAGLKSTEEGHQLDGSPPAHAEQPFQQCTVDDGRLQRHQFLTDLANS